MGKIRYKRIRINGGRMFLHRYIMEQHLGRKLTSNEIVHHIDENPFNNDITNLQLTTRSKHMKYHNKGKKHPHYGKTGNQCSFYGRKHTEEHKKKMSDLNMGSKNPMYGKKHTDESRKKMSATRTGSGNPRYLHGKFNDPIWLKEQYIDKLKTRTEIAKECNVSFQTIDRRLKCFGIT